MPHGEHEGEQGAAVTEVICVNSTRLQENQVRAVLRWTADDGVNDDLDLHCVTSSGAHCYHDARTPRSDLSLDVDAMYREGAKTVAGMVTRGGPETITIVAPKPDETYTFLVHDYDTCNAAHTGERDLSLSGATLTLHVGGNEVPRVIKVR